MIVLLLAIVRPESKACRYIPNQHYYKTSKKADNIMHTLSNRQDICYL